MGTRAVTPAGRNEGRDDFFCLTMYRWAELLRDYGRRASFVLFFVIFDTPYDTSNPLITIVESISIYCLTEDVKIRCDTSTNTQARYEEHWGFGMGGRDAERPLVPLTDDMCRLLMIHLTPPCRIKFMTLSAARYTEFGLESHKLAPTRRRHRHLTFVIQVLNNGFEMRRKASTGAATGTGGIIVSLKHRCKQARMCPIGVTSTSVERLKAFIDRCCMSRCRLTRSPNTWIYCVLLTIMR